MVGGVGGGLALGQRQELVGAVVGEELGGLPFSITACGFGRESQLHGQLRQGDIFVLAG